MYFQAIVNSFSGLGPFCFHFTQDERHTVLLLKQKLEQATTVGVDQQRIRTMGGRLLTDNDLLFDNQLTGTTAEPVILNMTVRLIGGLGRNNNNKEEEEEEAIKEWDILKDIDKSISPRTPQLSDQPLKKYKTDSETTPLNYFFIQKNEEILNEKYRKEREEQRHKEEYLWRKRKEKETRKRKNFAA